MTAAITNMLRWIIWPVLMAGFIAAYAVSQACGYDPAVSILAITVPHIVIIAALERWIPARKAWGWWSDRQVFNDIVHSLLLDVGVRFGNLSFAFGAAWMAGWTAGTETVFGVWPQDWPLLAQLALALLVYDFCDYWKHRAYHGWRWAWRFHYLHHDAARMHVLKAGRLHLMEAAIRTAIVSAPLIIMGASPEILFWIAALANAFGGQNHWNVDARIPRWLNWAVATPPVHWVHHDQAFTGTGTNFSPFTMVFDHLFGTFRDPVSDPVGEVGVADSHASGHVLWQLMRPFLPRTIQD